MLVAAYTERPRGSASDACIVRRDFQREAQRRSKPALAQLPTPHAAARAIRVRSGLAEALFRTQGTGYTLQLRGRDADGSVCWRGATRSVSGPAAESAEPTHSARCSSISSNLFSIAINALCFQCHWLSRSLAQSPIRQYLASLKYLQVSQVGRAGPRTHSSARPTAARLIRVRSTPECILRTAGVTTYPKCR